MEVVKNKTKFLINPTERLYWWNDEYSKVEPETYNIFDRFGDLNKVMIDIGTWEGPTVLYNADKFKHIYGIEADKISFNALNENISLNNFENITIISKAIYNSNGKIFFGKNVNWNGSQLNDSTSQIQTQNEFSYEIDSITIWKLFEEYNINISDIAIIKVDIEGGEEYILEDLLKIYLTYKTPLYISFHHNWWSDKESIYKYKSYFEKCDVVFMNFNGDVVTYNNIIEFIKIHPFGTVLLK